MIIIFINGIDASHLNSLLFCASELLTDRAIIILWPCDLFNFLVKIKTAAWISNHSFHMIILLTTYSKCNNIVFLCAQHINFKFE